MHKVMSKGELLRKLIIGILSRLLMAKFISTDVIEIGHRKT